MFLPENIDLAHSEKYNLSIRIAPGGFSFCIYYPSDASVFHFQETSLSNKLSQVDNVKKMIFDFGFFSQPFKETIVTIVSPDYTLVPDIFFDKKRTNELFEFNFHKIANIVLSNKSEAGDYHTVFDIDETLYSFLSRHLWNPKFQHQITPLLKLFENYDSNKRKNRCFVDFDDKSISIICFSTENKLLSANTFPITGAYDVSYFVANVWEEWQFDQTEDVLYFSGNTERYKSDILKTLIKNVEIVELESKMELDEEQKKTIPTDIFAMLD
jgi:hypothetical protein